ncbi:MAG: putative oxidoreductase C-terminal domain-containing protein [Betaproteobacteria bacterium]
MRHTLILLNPGHFHAALTLRKSHPQLHDDVYVYAEDGADIERFLRIVHSFNQREREPTHWNLQVYCGVDYFERLREEHRGDVVIYAGKNDVKMDVIHRLHADGFHVLGDKPWLIGAHSIALLRETTQTPPLAMDIMTERYEIACRLQKSLIAQRAVFGEFRSDGDQPALEMISVHHLYKVVNGQPLVRPAWYFDIGVQGGGITDVTTHLVDLAQWMTGGNIAFDYSRDVELRCARQWPTAVPLDTFKQITGLDDFPPELRGHVVDGVLQYRCNGVVDYRLRGIPVRLESIWELAIPQGGGDTHSAIARGTRADVVVDQGAGTRFLTEVTVVPAQATEDFAAALEAAIALLQDDFPGIGLAAEGSNFRIAIPTALRTTHEEHFAAVLDAFLADIDNADRPANAGPDLMTKYTLLGRAAELVHK